MFLVCAKVAVQTVDDPIDLRISPEKKTRLRGVKNLQATVGTFARIESLVGRLSRAMPWIPHFRR